jgi:DNA-directed RNA polymerase specialized sigma24 family protein
MFATTRWSQVLAANRGDVRGRNALESLCHAYWQPLYVYARKEGCDRELAADRVQGFFSELLESPFLERADAARGRFRAYLVTAFRRFLLDESAKDRAAKRGGGKIALEIDSVAAEERCASLVSNAPSPEAAFERGFALAVLDRALDRLREEYRTRGDDVLFAALRPLLVAPDDGAIGSAAESIGASEGATRVALHRLRSRYRASLRAVVADTVADGGDVDDELRALREVLVG